MHELAVSRYGLGISVDNMIHGARADRYAITEPHQMTIAWNCELKKLKKRYLLRSTQASKPCMEGLSL